MSYELSFSPSFFFNEGEPYDGGPGPSDKPTSVWQALESTRLLKPEAWADLARDVFQCEAQYLTSETVLDRIRETNTCTDLQSPVEVWIDPNGDYWVEVYDCE